MAFQELADALKNFGKKMKESLRNHEKTFVSLRFAIGLHVSDEQLLAMITKIDTTGKGVLQSSSACRY